MQNKMISRARSVDQNHRICAIERVESRLLLSLSTFLVNTTSDSSVGVAGLLTLRQAVSAANSNNVPSTIQFDPKVFTPGSLHTITLTQGELEFRSGVTTVNGPGAGVLAISGNQKSRVFQIDPKATVSLNGISVTGGLSNVADASYNTSGGGILNSGTLTLNQSTVSGNAVAAIALGQSVDAYGNEHQFAGTAMGGGISSTGPLTITNSILNADSVANQPTNLAGSSGVGGTFGAAFGGAVYCSGNLIASGDSFDGDSATGAGYPLNILAGGESAGGGIYAGGTVTISNSTVSGNFAAGGEPNVVGDEIGYGGSGSGGGLYTVGMTAISSSEIVDNRTIGGAAGLDGGISAPAEGGGVWNKNGLTISNSTVSNNSAVNGWDEGGVVCRGGGIFTAANLTLTQSTVQSNMVEGAAPDINNPPAVMAAGGGVFVGGTINMTLSSVLGNTLTVGYPFDARGGVTTGGGIDTVGGGVIIASTISGNTATGGPGKGDDFGFFYQAQPGGDSDGGGIYSDDDLTVSSSTISSNTAVGGQGGYGNSYKSQADGGNALGGGIYCRNDLSLTNVTLSDNTATGGDGGNAIVDIQPGNGGNGEGGGLFSTSSLNVVSSTLTGNTSTAGAGGQFPYVNHDPYSHPGYPGTAAGGGIDSTGSSATLTISIISGDKAGGAFNDLAGNISSSSAHDLVGVGGGLTNGVNGNIVGVNNPDLLPLGNYGGPTKTMVPIVGSPVINAGSVALIPTGLTTDQRGYSRTHGNTVDIGAVEFGNATITGTVFNDEYATGTLTKGDPGLAGFTVYLDLNHDGKYESTDIASVSNASGQYTFADVPAGTYAVNIVSQVMYRPTAPSTLPVSVVTTNGKTTTGPTFAETQDALLSGSVINSKTGKPLSGFRVYVDLNNDGKWESTEPSVVTASNGAWSFNIPSPGTYSVRILTLPGYKTASPANSLFTFVVGKASARIGNIFDELPTS